MLRTIVLPISNLFMAVFLLSAGYGLLMSLVGILLKESGVGDFEVGIINSAFFLGAILASLTSQQIISNVGHIRSFSAYAALLAFSALAHMTTDNTVAWTLFRLASGFAFYSLLVVIESWLNEKSSSQDRSKLLAIYTVVFYLSISLGQAMLNIDPASGPPLFVIGAMFVIASLIPIAVTRIKEPVLERYEHYSFPKVFSITPLALVGSLTAGFLVGGFFTMGPVYASNNDYSNDMISIFMIVAIFGGLLSQWPVGWFSDRFGRIRAIYILSIVTIIASLVFILAPSELVYVSFAAIFFIGVGTFSLHPLSLARANDVMEENSNVVEVTRSLLMAYGVGSFVSPIVIGLIMQVMGNEGMFVFFGLIALFLALYSLSKDRVPLAERSIYVAVPTASGAVMPEFDPRQDEEWTEEKKEVINPEQYGQWDEVHQEEGPAQEDGESVKK